jgi:hypothetical protein
MADWESPTQVLNVTTLTKTTIVSKATTVRKVTAAEVTILVKGSFLTITHTVCAARRIAVGLHVKCPSSLSNFNKKFNV